MPRFRYYITDTASGDVVGTNDEKTAKEFAQVDENFVVDTQENKWLLDSINAQEVQEQTTYVFSHREDN